MNDVVCSGNTRLNISRASPQSVPNERESQKNHRLFWPKPYLAQMLTYGFKHKSNTRLLLKNAYFIFTCSWN